MERGDSDGEDAMAYFLPNGIADDSPPKRSVRAPPSFGPIGGRFGAPTPLYGSLLSSPRTATDATAADTTRPSFLLSDLGGEIHEPRSNETANAIGIGSGRNPFAFSGAFASLASEVESLERSSGGGSLFDSPRSELSSQPASLFRSDADPFAPSTVSLGSPSLYGRTTLNANAPAFMASSQEARPFGTASPSAWPNATAKPRRAPPGLSNPLDEPVPVSNEEGTALSRPPGLTHGPHSASFGFPSTPTSTTSLFSGGPRPFGPSLRAPYGSLSGHFLTNVGSSESEYKSALSELNAKSMTVEEVHSTLEATAIAAAQDVVSEKAAKPAAAEPAPRRATKSPRQLDSTRGKPPQANADEKRKTEAGGRSSGDPRLRTPTRRVDHTPGSASPIATGRERRARTSKEVSSPVVISPQNTPLSVSDSVQKSARKARNPATSPDVKSQTSRTAPPESSVSSHQVPGRKKQPSSVSSAGSDDQSSSISTVAEATDSGVAIKTKESPRESKTNRASTAKKTPASVQSSERRGASRRQIYREKMAQREAASAIIDSKQDIALSGPESQSDYTTDGTEKMISHTESAPRRDDAVKAKTKPGKSKGTPELSAAPAPKVTDSVQFKSITSSEATQIEDTDTTTASLGESLTQAPLVEDCSRKHEGVDVEVNFDEPQSSGAEGAPVAVESDSGSEIPEVISRAVRYTPVNDRKSSSKKEKHKKEKADKKKPHSSKSNKKEKRDSSSSGKGDLVDEEPFPLQPGKKASGSFITSAATQLREAHVLVTKSLSAMFITIWHVCVGFAERVNLKRFLGWSFSCLESILAVVFSVILLLSLHGASWFIRIHRVAFRAVLTHRHVGFCFAFLYAFPFLVQYVFPWAPPWAPVCLWYAFLVQLFCTNGPTAMVATFRIILPLVFLIEGISHHSFLLDLNGAELLLASFILSAMKTSNLCSPIFLLSLAIQCLSAVFLGSELVVQWFQMALALYSLHAMAATEEDWAGLGDDEDEVSCRPLSMHHSITDYNYHPAPSAASIQKTKRLDRRALAYVRGRKFR